MSVTKASDATALHIATAGRGAFDMGAFSIFSDVSRVTGDDLVRRYGMWVARCISLNAQAAAGVPFKLMRVERSAELRKDCRAAGLWRPVTKRTLSYLEGRRGVQPSSSVVKAIRGNMDDLVEVDQHAVLDLLHESNDWTSGYQYRVGLYSDLQIFGRSFDLLINETRPNEMWSIRPQKMIPIKDPVEFVRGFKYGDDPDAVIYTPEEILWYRIYDPEDPWGGVGPLEAWLKTVDASFAIQDFQIDLMRRMGSPDWLLTKAPMDERQKRAFWTQWARLFGRAFRRERNIAIIDGEAELQRLNDTPRELEYNASAEAKRDEIGQAFGVPKSILDISQIKANNREAKNAHIETTVWPMVQLVEDVWNARLLPRYGDGIFIVHENPIPDDETIRIQERKSKLESGWTPNEIRIEEGVEPLPDPAADEAYLPGTLVPMRAGTMRLESDLARADMDMQATESELSAGEGEGTDAALLPGVETQPEQVLQGAQIAAALSIVQAVINEEIPIDSARGQLVVLFNLDDSQANAILAGVEGFEKPEPEMPMMLPPGQGPPPGDDEEAPPPRPEERMLLFEMVKMQRTLNSVIAQQAAIDIERKAKSNGDPGVTIFNQIPEQKLELPSSITNILVEKQDTPMVNVHNQMPEQGVPDIYVEAPNVNASIEPQEVKVNLPEQAAPVVNVHNKQDTPIVNIEPEININAEIELPPRKVEITRDRDTGRVTGAEVSDA